MLTISQSVSIRDNSRTARSFEFGRPSPKDPASSTTADDLSDLLSPSSGTPSGS